MPSKGLVQDVSSFFQAEWERAHAGWSGLAPAEQEKARRAALITGPPPGEPRAINIPGWDDVIHLAPKTPLDQERIRDHFAHLRRGEPGILTDAELGELDRRRGVRDRIRASAQPEYSKAFGQILTAIDNVQDFLLSVSVLGRVVLWPASKILGRAVPGLGWVLLASDLLNLLGWVGQLAMPLYALVCHGPASAAAAGIPAALFGRGLKPLIYGMGSLNPFSKAARLGRALRLNSKSVKFSEWLQVFQTTDQLWGVGISLGGLVGATLESGFAAERALRGEPTKVNLPGPGAATRALLAGPVDRFPTTALQDLQRASQVLADAPVLLRTQETFSDEEHLEFLTAYSAALDLLTPVLTGTGWQDYLSTQFDTPLLPVGVAAPATEELIREVDPTLDSLGRWALPNAPRSTTGDQLLLEGRFRIQEALAEFLTPRRLTEAGAYYGALVNKTADQVWILLEEDPAVFHTQLAPQYRVMEQLILVNRWLNNGQDEDSIMSFWRAAEALLSDDHPRTYTGAEWDLLARQHGLTLIRMQPAAT